jgi:hypothetical protein
MYKRIHCFGEVLDHNSDMVKFLENRHFLLYFNDRCEGFSSSAKGSIFQMSLEANSKIGFWLKISSSPKGFAGTRAAGPSFPTARDFPPDQILFVGRKPEAYCCMSRI